MVKKESNPIVMFFKRRAVRIVGIIGLSFVILYASAFTAIFLDSTLKNPEQIKFVTDPVAMKQCISNNEQIRMFTIFFFVLLLLGIITLLVGGKSSFKVDMMEITPEIRTPAPAGQGQHGTAKWLPKEKFDQVFDSDIIDSKKLMQGKESFSAGGLVLGKEDIKTSIFSKRVKEKIYHITKDLHALIIGATRSGKTRCIVIQTIIDLILAGENVVVPDLKGELRDYTEDVAKKYGYEVIGIDFIHPYQSKRRNFLEPVIKALQRNDISRAIEETWSLVSQLVGEPPENGEKLWNNGEAATLAASIMAVCYDNQDHPEYQNLTNVFYFITEMCSDYRGALPLQFYIDSLPEEHPAKILLAATKVAAMRTRSSFYVSAIMTLKLLTIPAINQMTNASDFDIEKLIDEGKKSLSILVCRQGIKHIFHWPVCFCDRYQILLIMWQMKSMGDEFLSDGISSMKRWETLRKLRICDSKHLLVQEKEFDILCLFSHMLSWTMYMEKKYHRLFRITLILRFIFEVQIRLQRRKYLRI